MSVPLLVREARSVDDEAVAVIVSTAYQATGVQLTEHAAAVAYRRAHGSVFVIEEYGSVVGTFMLTPTTTPQGLPAAKLYRFAVHPRAQRRGIGDAAVRAIISHARERGYYALAGFSPHGMDTAHRLYERYGARPVHLPGGVRYELDLTAGL